MAGGFVCGDCSKEFQAQESLGQHRQAVHVQHPAPAKRAGKLPVKQFVVAVFLLSAAFAIFLMVGSNAEYVPVTPDGDHVLGQQNASVTIMEYSDFQCDYCGKFFSEAEPGIIRQYVEKGKVKFVYRHFPILSHQYAEKAAEASECAADQGKFWEYHNQLFEHQEALQKSALKDYASAVGLDMGRFNACLASGVMSSRVKLDAGAGASAGVRSTPSFFINGKPLVGAQPYSAFADAIDAALG